mmetsp:Transcript_32176/g.80142  ORF Transcript_32176/g.80142 Transcript_32176/m.80142 type:complete len:156 (-) Transcript_32176:221-688(-)
MAAAMRAAPLLAFKLTRPLHARTGCLATLAIRGPHVVPRPAPYLSRRGLARRPLPPSVNLTKEAAERAQLLLRANKDAAGLRISIANDWGSHTGFTYTLEFVNEDNIQESDEKVELAGGGVLYLDRKALWAGEGGLLGATMDIDENFKMVITPKL